MGKSLLKVYNDKTICRIFLLIIIFTIVLFNYTGEIVTLNDGAGWDGYSYRDMIINIDHLYFDRGISQYHCQRILPFLITHIIIKLSNLDFTNENIIFVSRIQNIFFLLLIVCCFFGISKQLKWKKQTEIIAFCFAFFNFHVLKFLGYVPIFTDMLALLLSYALIYYYLKKSNLGIIIVGLLGMLTWPIVSLLALLLFAFPSHKIELGDYKDKFSIIVNKGMQLFYSFFMPILFVFYCIYRFKIKHVDTFYDVFYIRSASHWIVFIIAVISYIIFFWFSSTTLKSDWYSHLKICLKRQSLLRIICSIIVFVLLFKGTQYFGYKGQFSIVNQFAQMCQLPITDILIFLETPALYLGLFFVVTLFLWKKICNEVAIHFGFSYYLILLLAFFFLADIETRKLTAFYPVILLPLANVINRMKLRHSVVLAVVIIQLIVSFFWFHINVPGINEAFETMSFDVYMEFPAQRYYMFQGPWQSHEVYYFVLLGEIIVMSIIGYLHHKNILYINE